MLVTLAVIEAVVRGKVSKLSLRFKFIPANLQTFIYSSLTLSLQQLVLSSVNFSERGTRIDEITPKSVTQGKTLSSDEELFGTGNAVDKDFLTGAATKTDNGAGWMKFHFDSTIFVNKIIIYYRFYTDWFDPRDGCVTNTERFWSCSENDNNVDVSVYKGEVKQKSCGTLQLTKGLEQSDQIYTLVCNAEGDTVKLSKDAGVIAVFEVVVVTRLESKFSQHEYRPLLTSVDQC